MRLYCRWFLLAAVSLLVSGCQFVLPSHDYYAFGVARVGDQIHTFAPLCEGERIVGVEVYDNDAMGKETNFDRTSTRYTYWKVEDPVEELAAEGWIVLGDSGAYRVTSVAADSNIEPFSSCVAVRFDVV